MFVCVCVTLWENCLCHIWDFWQCHTHSHLQTHIHSHMLLKKVITLATIFSFTAEVYYNFITLHWVNVFLSSPSHTSHTLDDSFHVFLFLEIVTFSLVLELGVISFWGCQNYPLLWVVPAYNIYDNGGLNDAGLWKTKNMYKEFS